MTAATSDGGADTAALSSPATQPRPGAAPDRGPTAQPISVLAPVPGRAVPLAQVPDPVFAQAMVGPGAAIDPPRGIVNAVAPLDGVLLKVFPHAFVIAADAGVGVLVHLGLDTVQLDGEHFTVHVRQGERVRAGDTVTTWDTAAVAASGRDPIVPVVALDVDPSAVRVADAVGTGSDLGPGDVLLTVTR